MQLVFEGWMECSSSRCWQGATALLNEHTWLILRAEGVLMLAKSNLPQKRATALVFEGGAWRCWQGAAAIENERVCSFSRVDVVAVLEKHPSNL